MERKPFPDDYWIKDVPLEPVRIEMIESTALSICGERTSSFLREVIVYANKQMAHFSEHNQLPDIGSIQKSCRLMSEIMLVHVFDALGTPRP